MTRPPRASLAVPRRRQGGYIGFYAAGAMGQGGGGGGGFVYPPALILDPSDLSTLFQDSAGTTPVAADGDPVGRWNEKSGAGRNFIQATSGSRPVYRTGGGYHWVDFTHGQFMYAETAGSISFASTALFIGYRPVTGTDDYGAIFGVPHNNTHSPPFWRWSVITRTTGGNTFGYTSDGNQFMNNVSSAADLGNDVIMTIGFSSMWSSTSSAQRYNLIRINKTIFSNGSSGAPEAMTYPFNTPAHIGAHLGTSAGRYQGRIYGVLVADAAVTSQAWIDEWENWIDARTP